MLLTLLPMLLLLRMLPCELPLPRRGLLLPFRLDFCRRCALPSTLSASEVRLPSQWLEARLEPSSLLKKESTDLYRLVLSTGGA